MERSRADRILADWDRISRQARRPDLPPRRVVTTPLPASTITGAALLVLVVVATGLWLGLPPRVGQPGAQASASPVGPSRSPVEASASPVDTWGPLAVIPPQDGADTLAAEVKGWTVAEEAAKHGAAEIIGDIAEQVSKERPNVFVGSALAQEPGGDPTLYVKGPADKFVRDLVDASDIEIILADNQPFSLDELDARQMRLSDALVALGFRNLATVADITDSGRITAAVTIEPGLPSRPEEILSALPADLRSSVELTISDTPVVIDTTSFGGTLRITDMCVFLESRGEVTLLFWPADRTAWSAESRAITFQNLDGNVATVADGDQVVLGGGGAGEADSGISGEDWVRRTDWVAPPDLSCPLDPRWGVGAVQAVL